VARLAARAASMTARASSTRFASGLWTMTLSPFCSAAIEMAAWVWSGVITFTAVRSFSFSSISRKSV